MTIEEDIDCDGFSDDSDDDQPLQTPGIVRTCSWCENRDATPQLQLISSDGHMRSFCSDECYSACKNQFLQTKICDRCKKEFPQTYNQMIISEPSIQAFPLQFCTDQCLNRYKMELFCMEVQEQLLKIDREKIKFPRPAERGRDICTKIMITPDLWQTSMNDSSPNRKTGSSQISVPLCLERKRKSYVVENVISKLSKRHDSLSVNSSDTPHNTPTNQVYANRWQARGDRTRSNIKVEEKLSLPIQSNVSHYQNSNRNTDSMLPTSQSVTRSGSAQAALYREDDKKKINPSSYAFMPLPFMIPIPVPLPILLPANTNSLAKVPNAIQHDEPE